MLARLSRRGRESPSTGLPRRFRRRRFRLMKDTTDKMPTSPQIEKLPRMSRQTIENLCRSDRLLALRMGPGLPRPAVRQRECGSADGEEADGTLAGRPMGGTQRAAWERRDVRRTDASRCRPRQGRRDGRTLPGPERRTRFRVSRSREVSSAASGPPDDLHTHAHSGPRATRQRDRTRSGNLNSGAGTDQARPRPFR